MTTEPITEEIPIKIDQAHIKLKIDPEMVNKTIVAAILSSGIGDMVKASAEEFINNKETGWGQNGLRKAVGEHMTELVAEMCQKTEIRDLMRERIRVAITTGIIDKVVKASLEATIKNLERRY